MAMVAVDRWTVERALALPEDGNRYEVLDGVLCVTPAPAFRHQFAAHAICSALHRVVQPLGTACVIGAPVDIELDAHTLVQPDVCVLPRIDGRLPESWTEAKRLLLAVEVLSPSTAQRDRGAKRETYLRNGVPEYWIIDVDARAIERWWPEATSAVVERGVFTWRPVDPYATDADAGLIDVAAIMAELLGDP